jgi:nucleotide-binding universal stress UspA family protein
MSTALEIDIPPPTADESVESRLFVIGVDSSDYSNHAIEWARDNLLHSKDTVHIVNVRTPVYPDTALVAGLSLVSHYHELEENERNKSHELLRSMAAKLDTLNITVRAFSVAGDARTILCDKANSNQATALVIGSRGMGLLRRLALGSISDYCLHNCNQTVIVVKTL